MPGCLGHGSKSGETGGLLGVHDAKFRHFDQEHGGGQFTDARNAGQDGSPFGQFGVLGYPFGDIGFDGGDIDLYLGDPAIDHSGDQRQCREFLPVPRCGQVPDERPAGDHQLFGLNCIFALQGDRNPIRPDTKGLHVHSRTHQCIHLDQMNVNEF
jgi:hypothetical protein